MKVKELHQVSATALQEFYEYESQLHNMAKEETIVHLLRKEDHIDLRKVESIGAGLLDESGEDTFEVPCLIIYFKGKNEPKHISLKPGTEFGDCTRLNLLSLHVELIKQVWAALANQPIWYRYWIVSYLQNRLVELAYVPRLEPELIEDLDTAITGFTPVQVSGDINKHYRGAINAIKRTNYEQCPEEANYNIRANEIIPFVVFGNYYGFNQVIPFPHTIDLGVDDTTYEAAEPEPKMYTLLG